MSAGLAAPKPKGAGKGQPTPSPLPAGPPQPPDPHFTGDVTAQTKVYHFVDGKMVAGQQPAPAPSASPPPPNPYPAGSGEHQVYEKVAEALKDAGTHDYGKDTAEDATNSIYDKLQHGVVSPAKMEEIAKHAGVALTGTGSFKAQLNQHLLNVYKAAHGAEPPDLAPLNAGPAGPFTVQLTPHDKLVQDHLVAQGLDPVTVQHDIHAMLNDPADGDNKSKHAIQVIVDQLAQSGHILTQDEVRKSLQQLGQAKTAPLYPSGFHPHSKLNALNPHLPSESRPKLTLTEAKACEAYGGSAYGPLNSALYQGQTPSGSSAKVYNQLTSAFAKAPPFKQPVEVARGLSLDGNSLTAYLANLQNGVTSGKPIQLAGFQSTTTTTHIAFSGNIQLSIMAKHGIDLDPYSACAGEHELLLNHDTPFRVHSIEHTTDEHGDPQYNIRLEQLLPHETSALHAKPQPGQVTTKAGPPPKPAAPPAPSAGPAPPPGGYSGTSADAHSVANQAQADYLAGKIDHHELFNKVHAAVDTLSPGEKAKLAQHWGISYSDTLSLAKHVKDQAVAAKKAAAAAPAPTHHDAIAQIKTITDSHSAGTINSFDVYNKAYDVISQLPPGEKKALAASFGLPGSQSDTLNLAKHVKDQAVAAKKAAATPAPTPQPQKKGFFGTFFGKKK